MRYLVTGGAGFIGSNLVNKLIEERQQVTVVDDLSMGKKSNIKNIEKITFIEGSVTNCALMEKVLTTPFDYIFHLAAIASVADSIERPLTTHLVNYESVLKLMEICRKNKLNLKRVIFTSSAAIYGNHINRPIMESDGPDPLSQYAIDKYAAERTLLNYQSMYDIPITIVRFFNVFGPNQNPNSPYSGVISILLNKFRNTKESSPFNLYGDGKQTRDFIYVDEVVNALQYIADLSETEGNIYNIGNGEETSLNDVINYLEYLFDKKLPILQLPTRKGDIRTSVANNDQLLALGFTPSISVYKGLEMLVDYYS